MKIIVCMNCQNKNKIGGSLKGRTCKSCGVRLDTQDRSGAPKTMNEAKPIGKKEKTKEKETRDDYSGVFKQHGILCLSCKSVTPFKNKRCMNCKNKLRLSPKTTIYYNGMIEAIQCPKCGNYTDFKLVKCYHCKKKMKI